MNTPIMAPLGMGFIFWFVGGIIIWQLYESRNSDQKISLWSALRMNYSKREPFNRFLFLFQMTGISWIISGFLLSLINYLLPISGEANLVLFLLIMFGPPFLGVLLFNSNRRKVR